MSRRICVDLYEAIRKLRPHWHHDEDDKGTMKIVMSGSASDKLAWQPHIRKKSRRDALAKAFKNPKTPFKIVIVRDMWLTGFDAPCLHTMYPRLVDTLRGRSKADPFVIATAIERNAVVVTGEILTGNLEKPRIPDVCQVKQIPCINFLQMIRQLKLTF